MCVCDDAYSAQQAEQSSEGGRILMCPGKKKKMWNVTTTKKLFKCVQGVWLTLSCLTPRGLSIHLIWFVLSSVKWSLTAQSGVREQQSENRWAHFLSSEVCVCVCTSPWHFVTWNPERPQLSIETGSDIISIPAVFLSLAAPVL